MAATTPTDQTVDYVVPGMILRRDNASAKMALLISLKWTYYNFIISLSP